MDDKCNGKLVLLQITKPVTPNIYRPWAGPFESDFQQTKMKFIARSLAGNLNIVM